MKALLSWIVMWLKAARAPFLTVGAIPVCLGGAIAHAHGQFDWQLFGLLLAGAVLAQSAADFLDDYFDFHSGNHANKDQQFHDSPLLAGQITPGQVLGAGIGCGLAALGIGAYLLWLVGEPVLWLGLAGVGFVVFYTAPPLKLNYRGLGEIVLFLGFGPVLVLGVTYVMTGQLALEPVWVAVPVGLFTMAVGHVSNTFDHEDDIANGKRTLAVRLGQQNAVRLLLAIFTLGYLALTAGVFVGLLPVWSLIGLLTVPIAWRVLRLASQFEDLASYEPAMGQAILLTTSTGLLLCASYLAPGVLG